jgi:hypothetical protein
MRRLFNLTFFFALCSTCLYRLLKFDEERVGTFLGLKLATENPSYVIFSSEATELRLVLKRLHEVFPTERSRPFTFYAIAFSASR